MIELEEGYYWIKFKDDLDNIRIGYYEGAKCKDGSKNNLPWTVCGSDWIFEDNKIIVLAKIEDYKEIWESNK